MGNTANKNIIFLTNIHVWSLDAEKGGKAFFHTLKGYIEGGWNIWLVTTGGGVPQEFRQKANVIEKEFPGLTNWHNSSNRVVSVIGRFLKLYAQSKFYKHTAETIIVQNPHCKFLIYAYEVESVSAGSYIAKKFKLPLVTRFQGTILSNLKASIFNTIRRSPHFTALKTRADLVIMTNDGTQGEATLRKLKNPSNKIVFWRNGVDKEELIDTTGRERIRAELEVNNKVVFITVSRLIAWKRVHLAVEGFAYVNSKVSNSHLIIVGDGPEKVSLEAKVDQLGLNEHVTFTGAVKQRQVSEYLRASDIFLSFYDLSNLGNPIMEAMMVGLPLITIDVGDTNRLIHDGINGILIPANELTSIPEQMLNLYNNKEFATKLGHGARTTALQEFWSWETRIQTELNEVEKLLV